MVSMLNDFVKIYQEKGGKCSLACCLKLLLIAYFRTTFRIKLMIFIFKIDVSYRIPLAISINNSIKS